MCSSRFCSNHTISFQISIDFAALSVPSFDVAHPERSALRGGGSGMPGEKHASPKRELGYVAIAGTCRRDPRAESGRWEDGGSDRTPSTRSSRGRSTASARGQDTTLAASSSRPISSPGPSEREETMRRHSSYPSAADTVPRRCVGAQEANIEAGIWKVAHRRWGVPSRLDCAPRAADKQRAEGDDLDRN